MEDQPDLVKKVEKLQRNVFRMTCIVIVLFLSLAAGTGAIWSKRPKTVEASQFLVRDRTGNVVARLGQSGFGDTCLTLTANQNVSVANLCVQNEEGASLDLHNLKSESRATLTPGFIIYEPVSKMHAQLVIVENGQEIGSIAPRAINKPNRIVNLR